MGLSEYNRKRNFGITSEPAGDAPATPRADGVLGFVIQKHAATRLHYDFRLELGGVLLSWSVPKGPSLDPTVKRLAMHVEDHPLAYADFEGIIPKGQYGGGTVLLWDQGIWEPVGNPHAEYAKGNLKFLLKGTKLQGRFALVKLGGRRARDDTGERGWLLIKERDEAARTGAAAEITERRPESVTTGRTLEEIAGDRTRIWHSKPAHLDPSRLPGAKAGKLPTKWVGPPLSGRSSAPDGDDFLNELDLDGDRLVVRVDGDDVQLLSDEGTKLAAAAARKHAAVATGVRMLPASTLVVEGVVAALDGNPGGKSDGKDGANGEPAGYFVYDIGFLDGYDLRAVPLDRRKQLLAELVQRMPEPGPVRFLDHVAGNGEAFHREACRLGLPGTIARPASSLYGAKAGWLRIACAGAAPSQAKKAKARTKPKGKAKR